MTAVLTRSAQDVIMTNVTRRPGITDSHIAPELLSDIKYLSTYRTTRTDRRKYSDADVKPKCCLLLNVGQSRVEVIYLKLETRRGRDIDFHAVAHPLRLGKIVRVLNFWERKSARGICERQRSQTIQRIRTAINFISEFGTLLYYYYYYYCYYIYNYS